MNRPNSFRRIGEQRIGRRMIVISTIDSIGDSPVGPLPARGMIEGWALTEKGAVDRHFKYPLFTWQGSASELEEVATLLASLAGIVRTRP